MEGWRGAGKGEACGRSGGEGIPRRGQTEQRPRGEKQRGRDRELLMVPTIHTV